jgi:hypothetical protein
MNTKEKAKHEIQWTVEKFVAKDSKEIQEKGIKPYEVVERKPHNCLLHEGLIATFYLIAGVGSAKTAWNNANARLGVGDSATAPTDTQTGLQAATNKFWKAMNATYPQQSGDHDLVFQSDFVSGEAEYTWNEETIVNASSDTGDNLCRQNTALGTKLAAQTWRLTGTITWT